ncbi:MAG TPA: hypothetical protein VFB99_02200, partial [Vicinamibacterales bacterium]|nr:hypothetical protein [Vicinamibacterales bacterium]
ARSILPSGRETQRSASIAGRAICTRLLDWTLALSRPTHVLLVKFESALPPEEIRKVVDSRIDQFRAFEGLTQKYYLQDPTSGEYAGLNFWESADALAEFRASELRSSANDFQTPGVMLLFSRNRLSGSYWPLTLDKRGYAGP